jgi:hypothetical protein
MFRPHGVNDEPNSPTPHDTRTTALLAQLHGCRDLGAVFGVAPTAICPWPTPGRPKRGDQVLAANTADVLQGPVWLSQVDPRLLWASQPRVVRTHAEYYLTGIWERTGVTSADRDVPANRFPIIAPDHRSRLIIRTGHHRSLAALVEGRPLVCRLATAPPDGAVAQTPTLLVGTYSRLPHTAVDDVEQALELIATGTAVRCSDEVATAVYERITAAGPA